MRYLKRIFEVASEQDILEFCENYLAYLLDSHEFEISIKYYPEQFIVWLQKTEEDPYSPHRNYCEFSWDEIKEHYIPFALMLSKSYGLDTDILENNHSIFVNFKEEKIGESKHEQLRFSIDEIESIDISKLIDNMGIVVKR